MSTTDGTSGRPGSGPESPPAPSPGSSGSSPGNPSSSSNDTRPMSAARSGASDGPSGSGGSGGAATKTARAVPAQGAQGGTDVATAKNSAAPAKKSVPAQKAAAQRPAPTGRRVRLTVSRVDPWSAMKMSFLLSVALGIAFVVMVFVLWSVLAGMGIFDRVNDIAAQVFGADGSQPFDIMDYIGLGRVVSLSIVIGVIDVILITAIATLGAFLYNVSAALVGGLQLTLTDD